MTIDSPCPDRHHSPKFSAGQWSCADCANNKRQSEMAAAISRALDARDRGMAVAVIAHPDEASRVAAAIRRLAASGRPFSANDARSLHGVRGGVVGATFTALKTAGEIKPVGAETSTDRGTHGKTVALWVAA